jgi:hypothetical protein
VEVLTTPLIEPAFGVDEHNWESFAGDRQNPVEQLRLGMLMSKKKCARIQDCGLNHRGS